MTALRILSGSAAQGLVASLAPKFKVQTGFDIEGEFGAVGAVADKLRSGTPADIVVLTAAIIAKLAEESWVVSTSIADIGLVETAIAVRIGDPLVAIADAATLRDALLAADAIFVPDIRASTAGTHVAKILQQLGIADDVTGRLKIFPNGATAMRHMAESTAKNPIGATQATEIRATKGVKLSGALPKGCDLATVYTAGVVTGAVRIGRGPDPGLAILEGQMPDPRKSSTDGIHRRAQKACLNSHRYRRRRSNRRGRNARPYRRQVRGENHETFFAAQPLFGIVICCRRDDAGLGTAGVGARDFQTGHRHVPVRARR